MTDLKDSSGVDPNAGHGAPEREVAGSAASARGDRAAADAPLDEGHAAGSLGLRAIDSGSVPARQIGRYRVVDKIGEGGMASVYKAFDPSIERPLVIKFLHPQLCVDEEYRERFLREARAAGMLSHPNIVTVFDVGEIEGRPYIAMELLEGEPLDKRLEPGVPLPVREAVDLALQLASALDYAHRHHVYHRDVKPANVVGVGDGRTVKLTDFGIAHLETARTAERTTVGTVIGTPFYMSPEQTRGEKVDGRSDLFSLGVVLYQMLSGRRPFVGDSIVALMMHIAQQEPIPLEKHCPGLPASLRRIVERCLRKKPDDRFQTCAELADALRKVREEIDAEAGKRGQPRRVPMKVRLALAMALLVAVTMAITATFVSQRQYRTMMMQSLAHGASLSKLIAAETAASALAEDWVGIDVLVQEVTRTLSLKALTVADATRVVRVSNDSAMIGRTAPALLGEPLQAAGQEGVLIRRLADHGDVPVFAFEVPITFQDKRVGSVFLTLAETPLLEASRQSLLLMALLLVVTAAAVGVATYVIVERFSKPLALLRDSLDQIGPGRHGYRISESRSDEFGALYQAFDRMSARLDADRDDARPR
jgi:tRNA A-37 threonylcarbamoyl transferase component Bud32